jgi:predicted nucleotidyltransferase
MRGTPSVSTINRHSVEILDKVSIYLQSMDMDLSHPLRSLAPSLESSVLEVLAGTEAALSASTIARLAQRGTRTGQWPVLARLVQQGLVLAEPANTGSMYRLNRRHVLAAAVLAATSGRQEILRRLTHSVAQLAPRTVSAAVYGSFARREARDDSDVDLLLVTADELDVGDPAWDEQLTTLEDEFLSWTGNRLEVLTLSMSGLRRVVRAEEPLVTSWREDASTLCGRELVGLLDEIAGGRTRRTARRGTSR